MLIKTLNIDGFRGVNRLTIEPAKRVTLLVGENGTGKTAVLDGLAAALAGLVGSMRQEPPGEILSGLFCASDHERRWPSGPSGPPVWQRALRIDVEALWEAQAPFLNATAQAALHTVRAALTRALALEERPWYSAAAQDVLIKRPGEGGWRAVGCLEDGEGSFVRTVVALALRCADSNQGHVDAAACTPGVVLIDEVEQHLHPALQRNVLCGLCAAFPKLQIIATTHAPLLLAGALLGEDRVLRLHREEGEVAVTPLLAPCGKDAAQVLTGAWFGLASTLDDETLRMMAEHRARYRQKCSGKI